MAKDLEKEYQELIKLGEKAGIADLAEVYNQYDEFIKISRTYLQEFNPKFSFSTTNSTS